MLSTGVLYLYGITLRDGKHQKKDNHYTGWRKKNACFSNNCNFVHFQYKQIMLTPKQPAINAVFDYLH